MKTIIVLCISALCSVSFFSSSNISHIHLGGNTAQNTIHFSIENQGNFTQSLEYIVTQDELVLLGNGTVNLPTGMSEEVEINTSSGTHTYTLTATLPNGQSKTFSISQ
ncbi:MAG: hypothetical protein AAF849_09915 [Bacteroidota bacterium]